MLNRISSGAKSRCVSHVPASSPTTLRPACASGSTPTPPTAPRPTTTTSVSLSLVAMGRLIVNVQAHRRLVEHLRIVRGAMVGLQLIVLERRLIGRGHLRADAWISDQVPPDEVRVAAVVRVAERALN